MNFEVHRNNYYSNICINEFSISSYFLTYVQLLLNEYNIHTLKYESIRQ